MPSYAEHAECVVSTKSVHIYALQEDGVVEDSQTQFPVDFEVFVRVNELMSFMQLSLDV